MEKSSAVLSGNNIVIISPEEWGENLLSKHHIALALAKRGNRVWFVCPVQEATNDGVELISENLFLIRHVPSHGINRLPAVLARLVARFEVNRILRRVQQPVDIAWSFDPYHLQFLKLFKAPLAIYHPVDNHYTPLERRVVREADIIFSNSARTLSRLAHPRKFKVGHGVASHLFSAVEPFTIPGNHPVKVGYIGNLNNRLFAFDVFSRLVKSHPDIGFYLVGPRGQSNLSPASAQFFDWEEIDRLGNIYWLGSLPSSRIPSFLKQMDVLLVLYKADEHGFTVNPHKILEYLSSGKVVICPFHEENKAIEHLIVQSPTLIDLPDVFDKVVRNLDVHSTSEIRAARTACASGMTYDKRLDEIERILSDTMNGR